MSLVSVTLPSEQGTHRHSVIPISDGIHISQPHKCSLLESCADTKLERMGGGLKEESSRPVEASQERAINTDTDALLFSSYISLLHPHADTLRCQSVMDVRFTNVRI